MDHPATPPDPAGARPRVAVLFGGRSSEHAISCVTAGSVLRALDPARYDVVPVGIAPDGRWVLESGDVDRLAITGADALPSVDDRRPEVSLTTDPGGGRLTVHEPGAVPRVLGAVDVVFPLLHGPFGEDGTVQGLLETAGVRYVGAGVLGSAVGMDKHYMKVLLQAAGLPVLPFVAVTARRWRDDPAGLRAEVGALGYPVFVKPCRGGSSIGISKVRDAAELDAAVQEARRFDPKVIVEAGAGDDAREVECGVLDRLDEGPPEASLPGEIRVDASHDFYDFAAKYLPGEHTRLEVPADLPDEVTAAVRSLSVSAFEALSCEGLARVDFFVRPDGPDGPEGTVLVNEVNTMPGFTPTSMFPLMWAASGVDYPALVDRLVQLALRRPLGLR